VPSPAEAAESAASSVSNALPIRIDEAEMPACGPEGPVARMGRQCGDVPERCRTVRWCGERPAQILGQNERRPAPVRFRFSRAEAKNGDIDPMHQGEAVEMRRLHPDAE
jgi:hypothetical protein